MPIPYKTSLWLLCCSVACAWRQSGVITGYGAAGSLVIVLLWVYYSAQIFPMGAEFTWVYANTYGSRNPVTAG